MVVILALFCSIIAAVIIWVNFRPDNYEYDENKVYPAEEWRKIISLNVTPTELVYRPKEGLFVITNQDEVKVADVLPACLTNSRVHQYDKNLSPPIEVTDNPKVELPPPPQQPLKQITFDIPIQFSPTVDTDILGASSYAIYENGEVWCTERVVQRGQAIALGIAVGEGFQISYNTVVGFLGTFVFVIILTVAYIEIKRYIQKSRSTSHQIM